MKLLSITCLRNEGPFLLEWIAYHRLIGVTDFLIFSNDCDDGSDLLLSKLESHGIVRHIDHKVQSGESVQWQAIKRVSKERLTDQYDWVMFTDIDEYPVIHVGEHRFADVLSAIPEESDALVMPWRLFGANGCNAFVDLPVTGQFMRSAPPNLYHPIAGRFFKTIFRPHKFRKCGIHRPKRRQEQKLPVWIDGAGNRLPDRFSERDNQIALPEMNVGRQLIELNHYSLRSVESFLVKTSRGLANSRIKLIDLNYWIERNFNTVENSAISVWDEALASEISHLKRLPGIEVLHEKACAWHQEKFSEIIRTHEGYRLYCDCLHAQNSAALPLNLAMKLYAAFSDLKE